jgi:hypothetical protein
MLFKVPGATSSDRLSGYGYAARFFRMLELPVAATGRVQIPAICLDQPYYIANLHGKALPGPY